LKINKKHTLVVILMSFVFVSLLIIPKTRLILIQIAKKSYNYDNISHKIDKFKDLNTRKKQLGSLIILGKLRESLSKYYFQTEGRYPKNLESLLKIKEFNPIPGLILGEHQPKSEIHIYNEDICLNSLEVNPDQILDTGKFGYVANKKAKCFGRIFIDCIHYDYKKRQWCSF